MCDAKKRVENGEDRIGALPPGMSEKCASMMESMLSKFHSMMMEAPERSPGLAAEAAESAGPTATGTSTLASRERELVALGAAMGSNCVPCIEYHVPVARKAGLTDAQIREAIRLADQVRKVPARKVLDAALQLLSEGPTDAPANPDIQPVDRGATTPATDGACCG